MDATAIVRSARNASTDMHTHKIPIYDIIMCVIMLSTNHVHVYTYTHYTTGSPRLVNLHIQ